MVRYETDVSNSLYVAYGYDENMQNIFLSVYDTRLEHCESSSAEVNKVAEQICKNWGGSFLELRTSQFGLGQRVSKSAMAVFLRRFGVPQVHIVELMNY